jgi:hypothetical protein
MVLGGLAPPPPKPHLGQQAGGAGDLGHNWPRNCTTTAPVAPEGQSFLDNIVARFRSRAAYGACETSSFRYSRLRMLPFLDADEASQQLAFRRAVAGL